MNVNKRIFSTRIDDFYFMYFIFDTVVVYVASRITHREVERLLLKI